MMPKIFHHYPFLSAKTEQQDNDRARRPPAIPLYGPKGSGYAIVAYFTAADGEMKATIATAHFGRHRPSLRPASRNGHGHKVGLYPARWRRAVGHSCQFYSPAISPLLAYHHRLLFLYGTFYGMIFSAMTYASPIDVREISL